MRLVATLTIYAALVLGSPSASAISLQDPEAGLAGQIMESHDADNQVSQGNGGKSLSEAVEQVRRQTGGQILSAETRVKGNREVHHIKVLTKDGKVKTHKIQGRKRGD